MGVDAVCFSRCVGLVVVLWCGQQLHGAILGSRFGKISTSLLWPVLVFAKKTRKENLLSRLSRADTSKEGAEMLQRSKCRAVVAVGSPPLSARRGTLPIRNVFVITTLTQVG